MNFFHLLYFEHFDDNVFTIDNTTGQCSNSQMALNDIERPDYSLLQYCVCCGDYLPDDLLECPDNPWAPKGIVIL